MKRKLVKQGKNALTITLPSRWVSNMGLKAGAEVDIMENEQSLTIQGSMAKSAGSIDLDISGKDPMIKRILGAAYKAGYEEFNVRFSNSEELKTVQEVVVEEFIGFETISHTKERLVIRKVSEIAPEQFNTMMRRMFLIIKSMSEDMIDAVKKYDKDLLQSIALRDKDVNRISDFCRRVISQNAVLKEGRGPQLYFIAEQLEKVGDIYRDIAKLSAEKKQTLSKDTEEIFKEINRLFNDLYETYFSFNLDKMPAFGKKRKRIKAKIDDISKDTLMISMLRMLLSAIFDMNGPLMAAKI